MTYDESALLMTNLQFRGRIRVAVLKYADYIMGESPAEAAHFTRVRWAQAAFQNPDNAALQVQPATVMDANVQEHGPEISDAALQSAVETTLNRLF
jgi:hypothetical protein